MQLGFVQGEKVNLAIIQILRGHQHLFFVELKQNEVRNIVNRSSNSH